EDVAFGSEKNYYIQADIAENWGEYKTLVDKAEFDAHGRAVVNIRWVIGKGKILPMTTLRTAILLKRDPEDDTVVQKLGVEEATAYIESVDFCNPHLLVKDERKDGLRRRFFNDFFSRLEVYLVNTRVPVLETHRAIKEEIFKI
ncbi:MAG: hypothetical protein QG670_751, partial [Thermoproteota archaeon]|nr:hypothetical protein [Thermoproteota archaeon]